MAVLKGFPPSNTIGGGSMGVGFIGQTNLIFTRKFRWMFTGYNSRGSELFNSFVKVTSRPENNSFRFAQFCTMFDSVSEAQKAINNTIFAIPRIEYGTLSLLDGCGSDIERWEFDCIEAKLLPDYLEEEDLSNVVFSIDVKYESVEYVFSTAITPSGS